MTDIINTDASPGDTFYDMSEVREAMGDPRYRTSARYRDEVAAKLHRSQQAGTVVSQTSYHGSQKRTLGRDRDYDFGHPNANACPASAPMRQIEGAAFRRVLVSS
jgi:hypothetical protein